MRREIALELGMAGKALNEPRDVTTVDPIILQLACIENVQKPVPGRSPRL